MADRPRNGHRGTAELEDQLRDLKVDELREKARDAGISGVSAMRKGDLVHAVADAEQQAGRPSGRSTGTAQDSHAKESHGKNAHAGKASRGTSHETDARADRGEGDRASARPGGRRSGSDTSRSLQYAQEITSPDDEPERPGRSLVTTSHEVIMQWAQERDAVPATVAGTEHGDRPGVLRFDFGAAGDGGSAGSSDGPEGSGSRLREVGWDEWFATFDQRRLDFIYQEERSDGRPSTFFRLENPDREDA